jgi:tRNA G26 N,N-dimethylase Trm1
MWSGQLHNPDFIGKVLEHLEMSKDQYGTAARMKGMLTVAQEVRIIPLSFFYLLIIGRNFQRRSILRPAESPVISTA